MCLGTHGGIQRVPRNGWAWAPAWVRDVCAWCPRTLPSDTEGRMDNILEELLQHRDPEALPQYLGKVRALGEGGLLTAPGADWGDRPVGPFSEGLRAPIWEVGTVLGVPPGSLHSSPGPECLSLRCLHTGQALSSSLHPLGKLLRTLMLTFQATYAGIGANKHLQGLAQEEVKQHAQELWAAYR